MGDANGDKMADLYCHDSDYVTKVAVSTVKGKNYLNFMQDKTFDQIYDS